MLTCTCMSLSVGRHTGRRPDYMYVHVLRYIFSSPPNKKKPDYSHKLSDSLTEHRIMWIRTAIIEKTLQPIVGELRNAPGYVWAWFYGCGLCQCAGCITLISR